MFLLNCLKLLFMIFLLLFECETRAARGRVQSDSVGKFVVIRFSLNHPTPAIVSIKGDKRTRNDLRNDFAINIDKHLSGGNKNIQRKRGRGERSIWKGECFTPQLIKQLD